MKRPSWNIWHVVLMAPLVLAIVVFGLWVAIASAFENVRIASATDQILDIVTTAQDMAVSSRANDAVLTVSLLNQLDANGSQRVVRNGGTPQGRINPWNNPVMLQLMGATQELRLESDFPVSACRELLTVIGKNAGPFGLSKVDRRDKSGADKWTSIYEATSPTQTPPSLAGACGDSPTSTIALTFRLK